ncbi:MAG TPA: hypothetical protein IGS53_05290 [Leptolyngbyaceae cyanobacterium M33_DOE_097]|nr:hypothetical protein [Leptolyngbyaceae cyanobacterium M33_DOE_097]
MQSSCQDSDPYYPRFQTFTKEELLLVKSKLEYCQALYEMEMRRKETLERKTQFYLSLVTLFLSALLLKLDFFTSLQSTINQHSNMSGLISLIRISTFALSIATLVSLTGVLQAVRLQNYRTPSLMPLTDRLFKPDSLYINELIFLRDIAAMYSLAVEYNCERNAEKTKWIKVASWGILSLIFSFAVLMCGIAYSLFY